MADHDWLEKRKDYYRDAVRRASGGKLEKVPHAVVMEVCYKCNPKSLEAAAQFFGLDHARTPDCIVLAHVLAEVVFGARLPGRKKGAKPTWNSGRLVQLGFMYMDLKTENPKLSDAKIAEQISKDKEFKEYKNDPEPIRVKLRAARRALQHLERIIDENQPALLKGAIEFFRGAGN